MAPSRSSTTGTAGTFECRCRSRLAPERRHGSAGTTLGVILALALAGCELAPSRPAAPGDAREAERSLAELGEAMAYADRLRTLPEPAFAAERERLGETPGSVSEATRLALLLSAERAPFRDEAEAATILRAALDRHRRGDLPLERFAGLLLALLERQALEQLAHARTRRALAAERAERRRLEEQIEALKAIEQKLSAPPAPALPVQ